MAEMKATVSALLKGIDRLLSLYAVTSFPTSLLVQGNNRYFVTKYVFASEKSRVRCHPCLL